MIMKRFLSFWGPLSMDSAFTLQYGCCRYAFDSFQCQFTFGEVGKFILGELQKDHQRAVLEAERARYEQCRLESPHAPEQGDCSQSSACSYNGFTLFLKDRLHSMAPQQELWMNPHATWHRPMSFSHCIEHMNLNVNIDSLSRLSSSLSLSPSLSFSWSLSLSSRHVFSLTEYEYV